MDTKWLRNSFVYLIIMVAILAVFFTIFQQPGKEKSVPLTDLYQTIVNDAKNGNKDAVLINGNKVTVKSPEGTKTSWIGDRTDVLQQLRDRGVQDNQVSVEYQAPSQWGNWLGLLGSFLPLIIFGGLLLFMMRQAQGTNNQALSFGKSRARMFLGNKPTVTFVDVAGVDEAKQELAEVVEFLKYPDKFAALGARIPRGVLLVGPPGTGKTLLSRAVAGEAGVPFFSISGSEFVEMFVGVGASRVRDLFDQAKRNSPCIVFVDEIDAVGRQRGAGLGGSHDEREQTLNQILVEMDGFDTNTNVIVIAATNRPDVLDPALLRPGRFDRQVVLDRPDIKGRRAILEVHAKGKPLDKEVSLDTLAKQTPGFSGADLSNLVNEAAILAARRNKKSIFMMEMEEAIDRVVAGPERKSRIISEKEKAITAYHEVGHALVARALPNCDPVHKLSIVARGMMGGYTRFLPVEDRYLWTRSQFEDNLASLLGGHTSEEIIFGESTTGPSNDIERATQIARRMVTEYGMSAKIGPIALGHKEELVFLGRDIGEQRNYSEATAQEIDQEVRRIVEHAHDVAREILTRNREKLVRIAERLIKDETIEGPMFEALFNGDGTAPEIVDAPPAPPEEPAVDTGIAASTAEPEAAPQIKPELPPRPRLGGAPA
ncbi:MAG TPA: ATP-dependent zinc metalloprotease FtsH [Chloroflexota bacterium]|nr:ATP-dependent zinc metalloprotease FtsH [Chloroflexota bacterium]